MTKIKKSVIRNQTTLITQFQIAIDRADLQPATKVKYKREIENLVRAGICPINIESLEEYANNLKSSRKSFLKSALRLILAEFELDLKGTWEYRPNTGGSLSVGNSSRGSKGKNP